MDIFNKKKIKELESRIRDLEAEDKSIWAYFEQKIKEPKYFSVGSAIPEDAILSYFGRQLGAIKDYLKIDIKFCWKDDPNYDTIKPPQIRKWYAEKRKLNQEDE